MTVDSLLKKIEKGEKVTTPRNDSLLLALQVTMNDVYIKFAIDIDVDDNLMTLEMVGSFEKKALIN